QFRTSVIVANTSSMPNAAIAVEVAFKRQDKGWEDVAAPRAAGLPLNLPPMTTVRLDLDWSVQWPALAAAEALRPSEIARAYREHYYAKPAKFGIAIWSLGETEFRAVLPLVADRAAGVAMRWSEAA